MLVTSRGSLPLSGIHWGVLPGSFMWLSSSRAQEVIFSAWSMYKYFYTVTNCCLMGTHHNQHAVNTAVPLTCSSRKPELPWLGMTQCSSDSVTVASSRGKDKTSLMGYSRGVLCHHEEQNSQTVFIQLGKQACWDHLEIVTDAKKVTF